MMRYIATLFMVISSIFLTAGVSSAITVTASPNPATVNQMVTVNTVATFSPSILPPSCTIEVNYGDGSPWVDAGVCSASPCSLSTSYTYTTSGTYTVTAQSKTGFCPTIAPDPATTSVTVQCVSLSLTSPISLTSGTAGQAYTYQLQTSGGQSPIAYSLTSGSLPAGLSVDFQIILN